MPRSKRHLTKGDLVRARGEFIGRAPAELLIGAGTLSHPIPKDQIGIVEGPVPDDPSLLVVAFEHGTHGTVRVEVDSTSDVIRV